MQVISLIQKLSVLALCIFSLAASQNALAGIPVIDATNLAQQVQQVAAWGQQFNQMKSQFTQLQQTYDSLNGVRGMVNLVNNPTLRKYLPQEYKDILNSGYGSWGSIRSASKVIDIFTQPGVSSTSAVGSNFNSYANQVAINRAVADEGYKQASDRFSTIQVLLDKVNDTPDSKDVAELSARIQAEQVMMQNEQTKLMMLTHLADAQRDLANQHLNELIIKTKFQH